MGGTWIAYSSLGPVFGRSITSAFAPLAGRIAGGTAAELGAAALGRLGGAFLGLAGAVALDYLLNKVREWADREDFEATSLGALHAVRDEWAAKAERQIGRALDVWFDDARAALLRLDRRDSWLRLVSQ